MTNYKFQMTNEGNVYRILDANVNRAMEGIRVAEEVARFILEDKKLTKEAKTLRGELKNIVKKISKKKLLSARKSLSDVGGKLYTKEEKKRGTIMSVFKSNVKRAQEALRVLEEFIKLIQPELGKGFKGVRFRLYEIEKTAFTQHSDSL